mmetsp:Transcript_10759/g.30641  ORF Transcript_10759/g.30641 Transcript_10759/m.30641 type:complete len:395 (+) Transcript_10759:39-1223(+)
MRSLLGTRNAERGRALAQGESAPTQELRRYTCANRMSESPWRSGAAPGGGYGHSTAARNWPSARSPLAEPNGSIKPSGTQAYKTPVPSSAGTAYTVVACNWATICFWLASRSVRLRPTVSVLCMTTLARICAWQIVASTRVKTWALQMDRMYFVCTPCSLDSFSSVSRWNPHNSTPSRKHDNFVANMRSSVSPTCSFASCLMPGSKKALWNSTPFHLPTCMNTEPLPSVARSTTSETTRVRAPVPEMTTMASEASTSSRNFSMSPLARCACICPRATRPMVCCTCLSMETTSSQKSVKGTCKSVGHTACGGPADATRLQNCLPYSTATPRTMKSCCKWTNNDAPSMQRSLQEVPASALPTCVHSTHNAASQNHWPTSASSDVAFGTGDESGYCE